MASGVPGTGSYGLIRRLQTEINLCKYEIGLIEQGMRRQVSKKRLEEVIAKNRAEIRQIKAENKAKKKFSSL